MIKTDIYIGLNDLDTKQQKFSTSKYLSILKKVCRIYGVPFSVSVIEGGYVHENGEYTEENSLVLSLIDADQTKIREIAEDLCTFFHQESVLVTRGEVEAFSIKSSIKEEHPAREKKTPVDPSGELPNTETMAAIEDCRKGDGLSGVYDSVEEPETALNTEKRDNR